ncbi:PUA-like domain-containing protein [Aspergillus floccosus]
MEDDTISPHPLRNGDNDSRRSLTPNTVHCTPPPSSPTPSLPSTDQTSDIPLTQAVLRLIQCSQCSRPLQTPLRLPCGNTVCRGCLPPLHRRRGVTYPATEERKDGFTCSACLGEHCVGDCGTDVLLTRLVEVFDEVLRSDATEAGESPNGEDGLRGGMEELYALIRANRFDYNAYGGTCERDGQTDARSAMVLARLTERLRGELDCHVCYSLILDPLTTCCGHTFCHRCVAMVLDHSDLCPVCRRKLNMSSTLQCEPVNKRVAALIETLFPEQIASRREASALEESNPNETSLPLFVSSLSLPTMPTFLHIFEPRYRLMIRRVMQSRGRKFGMVMYNRAGRLQEGLGRSQFLQYGTVLVVDRYELLPDGRSLVVATGVSRFKVLGSVLVDGYHVGRIQRVEDISITEEEAREALETSATAVDAVEGSERPLDSMSTQELFQFGLDFVRRQHGQGAVWLRPRALLAYGDIPTDPVRFPWWFASILPVWEEEKYALLSATSVRERLKITARWIRKLESPVPLLIFAVLPIILGAGTTSLPLGSSVFTTFTPFSMSVSVSFGSAGPFTVNSGQPHFQREGSETHLPQIVVVSIFLAIFLAQVAVNAAQVWRTRRRNRVEAAEQPPTTQAPANPQGEAEGEDREPG